MLITKKSEYSGIEHSKEIDVNPEKYNNWEKNGRPTLIQKEFPELSPEDREFILTGVTPDEWEEIFKDSEFDEYMEEVTEECDDNNVDYSDEFEHE